ncbi:AAA family ATPase [Paraferrimonas haliotis]|uniref:ATPase AAA n=1 Tax=Paraferrimonas haliotis TaxID=2013866 RepID=A0AA37WXT4_9GAMM|nr:AAA family ATPase [Paraferrimonas haliotis]GLS84722.1 ATPase AAA [Paraferrimonas haliotis]
MQLLIDAALAQLNRVILDKPQHIKLALACVLARGHLLIEDLPGVGKSTLSHALALTLGLSHQRVQFTSDMLPADLTGLSIFDQSNQSFVFHPGPLFHQVVLADEINRASPKTQSALLEAMSEQKVSIDSTTHDLPHPFFVIASQNPLEQSGTFPLPESQLDRFMMRLSLGYPSVEAEFTMLANANNAVTCESVMDVNQLLELQSMVDNVSVSEGNIRYIVALVHHSRQQSDHHPLSPRASKAILCAAKAWAFIHGRDYVIPDDVQAIFEAVAQHRLSGLRPLSQQQGAKAILADVNPLQ